MRKLLFLILLLFPSLCWGQTIMGIYPALDSTGIAQWNFLNSEDVYLLGWGMQVDAQAAGDTAKPNIIQMWTDSLENIVYDKIDTTDAVIDSAVGAEQAAVAGKADSALTVTHQGIKKFHADSTSENFAFDGAYHVTSAQADSAYVSRKEMRSRDQVKSFVIQTIDSDHDIKLWKTPVAITIDSIFGQCDGGTNVIGALDEYDWDNTDLVAVVNADWTFTTTYQAIGSFTNAGIAAKNHLKWHTTSVSGEVDFFDLTIWYHED